MKKIIGIAPLIIALILGTCFSSQAQIVMVQPVHIDGGFGMHKNLNGTEPQKTSNGEVENSIHLSNDINTNTSTYSELSDENAYFIIEYEVRYSVCTYHKNEETDLQSGSYYCKLVGCKRNNETYIKKLN